MALNKPICLIDMDGVLFDFIGAALKLLEVDPKIPANRDLLLANRMDDIVGKGRFWSKIDAAGEAFWSSLDLFPWSLDLWALAQREFGKDHTFILTSPSKHPSCVAGKMRSLQKHLKTHNFMMGSAKFICARPNSLLIDDTHKKVKKFEEYGGRVFHFPHHLLLEENPSLVAKTFEQLEIAMQKVKSNV